MLNVGTSDGSMEKVKKSYKGADLEHALDNLWRGRLISDT